jgi:hypothetical protein
VTEVPCFEREKVSASNFPHQSKTNVEREFQISINSLPTYP